MGQTSSSGRSEPHAFPARARKWVKPVNGRATRWLLVPPPRFAPVTPTWALASPPCANNLPDGIEVSLPSANGVLTRDSL